MVTFLMATMRCLALHLDDAVDEEEGVAVREDGHDLDDVHRLWAALAADWRADSGVVSVVGSLMARMSINGAVMSHTIGVVDNNR